MALIYDEREVLNIIGLVDFVFTVEDIQERLS